MKYTRTIKVYTYYTGKFNPVTMSMENMAKHTFPEELGTRAKNALAKEYGPIINVATDDVLIEIDALDFIRNGSIKNVNGEEIAKADRQKMASSLNLRTLDNMVEWLAADISAREAEESEVESDE